MCLAIVALDAHPRYRVVIAANRDEFHARPAAPAHWWTSGMLAGEDLIGGGAWFGVTRSGRWALVTNYREGIPRDPAAPSRGKLVTGALLDPSPPLLCAAAIARDGARYHGFSLLVGETIGQEGSDPRPSLPGDRSMAAYVSNRASGAIALPAGIHGLSNHLLETPWPKLVRSKARLADALDGQALDTAAAFVLLADREPADDATLPATGVPRERERMLSSAFIVSPDYGTRCSTVFTLARDGSANFVERSFDAAGNMTGETAHAFTVAAPLHQRA
ncbi:MAG TPA: NRDE family protein [Casimicrobiaceae bacterium]|jgi:uncharacterized protein with NRDE domain|nr:NRDE family protein [Casimicrobiaceae bacterium]